MYISYINIKNIEKLLYLFQEKIKADSQRVNVTKITTVVVESTSA